MTGKKIKLLHTGEENTKQTEWVKTGGRRQHGIVNVQKKTEEDHVNRKEASNVPSLLLQPSCIRLIGQSNSEFTSEVTILFDVQ
jgi:hypothetical protein